MPALGRYQAALLQCLLSAKVDMAASTNTP